MPLPIDTNPILVTGAAGFIGSHVCGRLLASGASVVGVDNYDPFYSRNIKARNIAAISAGESRAFTCHELDIADPLRLNSLFEAVKPRTVIHLAAKAGVRPSIADPAAYARANVLGTSAIMAAAAQHGCQRVVMASSSSVYGNCPTAPFHEELDVNTPISPYAATKRACELLAHTHHHLTSMPTACLRFFTVFGPRQRPDLAISQFLGRISRGEPIQVFGDGTTSRDYTYVDDIVTGILSAVEHIDRHGFRIWNLGNSTPITLSRMVDTIARTVGREPVIERRSVQPGDVERTWADLTRARAELNYQPATSFEAGVLRQWQWLRAQPV